MEQIRQYVLSIVAAAVIVGILTELVDGKSTNGILVRLIGGLFLAFTVIRPAVSLEIGDMGAYIASFSENGEEAAAVGENLALETYCSYIKSETEAYILDKAKDLGASLSVEVTLTEEEPPVPTAVRIQGNISPYARTSLEDLMEDELGISKENQIWIG